MLMYKIAYQKHGKPGLCELCQKWHDKLEDHHVRYKPEIVCPSCHQCHFTAHYFPERLSHQQKLILLHKVMSHDRAEEFLAKHSKDRVKLALAFAPSRRDSIKNTQRL